MKLLLKLIAGGLCMALPAVSHSYYFWDQGFNNPAVKTNYLSLSEGTYLNPITLVSPCLFSSGTFNGCQSNYQPPAPTSFGSASNAWWQNTSWYSPSFWVLANNNETVVQVEANPDEYVSSSLSLCNSGPPNISLPRSAPGSGIFGFTAITDPPAGEYFYRAHLVLNQSFSNPCGDATPFLSIGAQDGRGQSGPLGALNPTAGIPSTLQFTAKVYDFKAPDPYPGGQRGTSNFWIYIIAEWPDAWGRPIPRMLFIDLFHWNMDSHLEGDSDWNWSIQEDYLYSGADLAFFDAEDVFSSCGIAVPRLSNIGQQITYNLSLQGLFQCASNLGLFREAMPATSNLPIRGIHWANEGTGINGWLWTSVHGMYMY